MKRAVTRLVLIGSGGVLGLIGGALMISPKTFLETSDVFIEHDPGLMSELAAPGGLLIITGALMLVGAVKLRFASLALVVGAVVYGSYGMGRVVSMTLHGLPSQSLISATIIEFVIALVLASIRLKHTHSQIHPHLAEMTV